MIDDNFMNEIIYAIAPYVENRDLSDIRMRLAITLSKYDVRKQETELIPYEGDVNIEILKRFLMAKTARGLSKRTLEYYKKGLVNFKKATTIITTSCIGVDINEDYEQMANFYYYKVKY